MNPSLLLIPDRYKASKLYSQIPDSGAGDLAFTRANDTATRVNSAGLIEKVRTNLATFSNDFSNASWAKITDGTFSLVTESIVDAFGNTSLVYKFTLLTGTFFVFRKTLASATTQTTNFSVYLKLTNTATDVSINIDDNPTVGPVSTTNWQRLSNTRATASFVDIEIYTTGQPFYIFASQIELGDIATPYIPTTTAAVSVGPVANIPRIDYTGGGCGKLLLEPQRTNNFQYSEHFDNAYWSKVRSTITANSATSPDGSTNADIIFPDTSPNITHELFNNVLTGAVSQWSGFFKMQGHRWVYLFGAGDAVIFYDLQDGVVGTVGAGVTGKIENYGNGWYRCSYIKNSGTNTTWGFGLAGGNESVSISGTPNTSEGVQIYGFQAEAGSYPTSYIPTLGASVTRSADAASKTGISSLIGQSEGVLYAEAKTLSQGITEKIISISDGTAANVIYFSYSAGAGNQIFYVIVAGGVLQSALSVAVSQIVTNKIAIKYKANDCSFWLNGTKIHQVNSANMPTGLSVIQTTYPTVPYDFEGDINSLLLYPTALSDAQLQTLTTL